MDSAITPTPGSIATHGRTAKTRSPVAIEKGEREFIFHYESEAREWTLDFADIAMSYLRRITGPGSMQHPAGDLATIRVLRQFGLLVLDDRGDILEPVTLSELGHEVKRALAKMHDARPGMKLTLQGEFTHTDEPKAIEQQRTQK